MIALINESINKRKKRICMSNLPTIFAALSDTTRFAIVQRLLAEGELPAGVIAEAFPISGAAVSRHLEVLTRSGLVHRRANRQQRLYSVVPESIEQISIWTMSHRDFWENSLRRLERALLQEGN
jgi:DNA-binding transcriptional ArsR family regulator